MKRKVEVDFEAGGLSELYGRMAFEMSLVFLRNGVPPRTIASRLLRAGHGKEAIRYGIRKARAELATKRPVTAKQLACLFQSTNLGTATV